MLAKSLGSAWAIPTAFFFALMGVFVKKAGSDFSFLEILFYRSIFACIFLIIEAFWHRRNFYTKHPFAHLTRGTAGSLGALCFFYAITHINLATATTFSYTSPIWLAVLSFIFLKEKVPVVSVICLVIGFIGVVLLLNPTISKGQIIPAIIGVFSGIFAGWAYFQIKELTMLQEPEWKIVLSFSMISALFSFILICFTGWHPITFSNGWLLLGVGFFALMGQMSLTYSYHIGNKYVVACLSYTTIVLSVFFGYFVFDDKINLFESIGIILIFSSGIISSLFPFYKKLSLK